MFFDEAAIFGRFNIIIKFLQPHAVVTFSEASCRFSCFHLSMQSRDEIARSRSLRTQPVPTSFVYVF